MTWTEIDIMITDMLRSRGYDEIPENKMPETASSNFRNKGYMLKPIGLGGIDLLSGDAFQYEHKVRFEACYVNTTPKLRDENYAEFIQVIVQIVNLTSFHSFNSDPSFEDFGDNLHTKGVIEFLIGVEISV